MLNTKLLKSLGYTRRFQLETKALYSRKSSSKNSGLFKVVSTQDDFNEVASHQFIQQANWELFAPPGFRFYMPGSIGPAWHDPISTGLIPSTLDPDEKVEELECTIQDCPVLLRQAVVDLFPGAAVNSSTSTLTVLTLSQKTGKNGSDQDYERLTRRFMLLAQDICGRLKFAGFWADFINPFSGTPYLSPYFSARLSNEKERVRLLGFRVDLFNGCRVINNKASHRFLGSIFTSAPANASTLQDVLRDYESSWKK